MKSTFLRLAGVIVVGFGCCLALPAELSAQAPAATPAASPAKKTRAVASFHGEIDALDAAAKSFTIKGKKNTRTFLVTPTTTIAKRAGGNATFDDLKTGVYVSGSDKKTGEHQFTVVSLKVGPKDPSAPPAKKKGAKKAAAQATPAQ